MNSQKLVILVTNVYISDIKGLVAMQRSAAPPHDPKALNVNTVIIMSIS